MKTWLKIVLGIFAALVLVVAGAAFYLTRPVAGAAYSDSISHDTREANSVTLTTLKAAGIDKAMVLVNETRVYIAYSVPAGVDMSDANARDQWQAYVLGVASKETDAGTAILVQYDGATPRLAWSADIAAFKTAMAGSDPAAFFDTVAKTEL